jgi:peptidoglycan pentaglycine glycine transferase (the first glycine)
MGQADEFRVRLVDSQDPLALAAEASLDSQGFALPLPSRPLWGRLLGGRGYRHALAFDPAGHCAAMLGFSQTPTRALPGHQIVRLEAVGDAFAGGAGRALIGYAAEYAKQESRVLRVVVELECHEEPARATLRESLARSGFVKGTAERVAPRTLKLELSPEEPALFAGLSKSTRQNIRGAAKAGLELQRLSDPGLCERMNELLLASFARTGSRAERVEWGSIMQLSRELPHRSNLVGAFRTESGRTELVAYAWCMHHGDRAEYSHGASARIPGVTLRILTPVLWELIRWAKQEGARWFDFGGITPGSTGSGDALGGVSDFKRGFSKQEIDFGEEWSFEPSPIKAGVARLASSAMERVRKRRRSKGD